MPRSDHQLQAELALWIIQLNDENPHTREQVHLKFLKWQQDHPEAQELLANMLSFSENMQHFSSTHHLSSKTAQQSLQTIEIQQKKTLERFKFTTLGLILIIGGLFSYDQLISQPTYQTLIGEKQSYTLPDGSKIILGADSKIRLHYNAQIRHIELVDGEIYVDVAQDQKRPFVIKTKYANFKALGTRFIVDQYYDKSRITMLHSTVEISALNLSQQKYASMGEQFLIQSTGDWNKKKVNSQLFEQAWQQQLIIANQLSLSDLLDKLEHYHQGLIIFDRTDLSKIKIDGVINAKQDLNRILELVQLQHPSLNVKYYGAKITRINVQ